MRRQKGAVDTRGQADPKDTSKSQPVTSIQTDVEEEYQSTIKELLRRRGFEALDQEARSVRASKARFPGGIWKLYMFYQAVTDPAAGSDATPAEWNAHLATLKDWIKLRPQSITARVALALAFNSLGENARGTGFADTVTEQGWKQMADFAARARSVLTEAASLQEKCPHWYAAMQDVALTQGWEKSEARALLDQAIKFEPTYYHNYRLYTNSILPKWNGDEGEADAFIEEVANRVGGQEGAFLYFELATVTRCQCGIEREEPSQLSWPRIKQGYAALEKLYGTSRLKMNRYAYMAVLFGDRAAAHEIFTRIGGDREPTVWKTQKMFDDAQGWAMVQ